MIFNEENTIEKMLLTKAAQCGWKYVASNDIPRSTDSVLVEPWLQDALIRLNGITADQAAQVIYKLRSAIMSGNSQDELIQANDRFAGCSSRRIPSLSAKTAITSTSASSARIRPRTIAW